MALSSIQLTRQTYIKTVYFVITVFMNAGYICYLLSVADVFAKPGNAGSSTDANIFLLVAASLLLEAVLEIPTGLFADRHGHALAVRFGFGVLAIHALLYVFAAVSSDRTAIWSFGIAAEVLLAVGTALHSGALNAWFVESMKSQGYDGEYSKFFARRRLLLNGVWFLFGSLAIALGEYQKWLPFALSFLAYGVGTVVASRTLRSDMNYAPPVGGSPRSDRQVVRDVIVSAVSMVVELPKAWRQFVRAISFIAREPVLRLVMFSHAGITTMGLAIGYFWKDLVQDHVLKPLEIGAASAVIVSGTWVAMVAVRILASDAVARMKPAKEGDRRRIVVYSFGQLLLGVPMVAAPILVDTASIGPSVVFGCGLLLTRFGQELAKPIATAWIHERTHDASIRATVDSAFEGLGGLGFVPVYVLVYWRGSLGLDMDPLALMYCALGVGIVAVGIPLSILQMRAARRAESHIGAGS